MLVVNVELEQIGDYLEKLAKWYEDAMCPHF